MSGSLTPPNVRSRWYKSKWVLAAAVGVLILAGIGVYLSGASALRARFLKAPPNSILADPELARYAQSHGAAAFQEHCVACHGAQAQGDRHRAIPDLTDQSWLYGSGRASELERIVLYGIRSGNSKGWDLADMPAFAHQQPYRRYKIATLLPREIDDITAYLLSLQKSAQKSGADVAAIQRGELLFRGSDRGVCWDCHGEDAEGDTAIGAPDLTDTLWLSGDGSQASIYDAIAFGLAGNCPAWIERLPPETIRAIAVYVYTLSKHAEPADGAADAGK